VRGAVLNVQCHDAVGKRRARMGGQALQSRDVANRSRKAARATYQLVGPRRDDTTNGPSSRFCDVGVRACFARAQADETLIASVATRRAARTKGRHLPRWPAPWIPFESTLAYEGDEPRRVGDRRDVPQLAEGDAPRIAADVDGLGELPRLQREDLD